MNSRKLFKVESVEDIMEDGEIRNMEEKYDSAIDTYKHKDIFVGKMNLIICVLLARAQSHDDSKLMEPEKSVYDKYIPELKKHKYGTPEYHETTKKMGEGLKHHKENNPHHPEYYKNGISDMTLIDVMDMFVDWESASVRSDTDLEEGLKVNQEKFGYSDELQKIFINTARWFKDPKLDNEVNGIDYNKEK